MKKEIYRNSRKMLAVVRAIIFAGFLIGLCDVTNAQQSSTKVVVHKHRASEVDPQAKEYPEIDFVFTDAKGKPADMQHAVPPVSAKSRGKLVIWLMGYNAGLFERLSGYGFHSIEVHYANKWFGKLSKEAEKDPEGLGNIRLEAATGEDVSSLVQISRNDSIAERTRKYLLMLSKEYPKENWSQFLSKDKSEVAWDKVTLAGISHGSTTAARFALHTRVDRVVMFAGPRDNNQVWQSLSSQTPKERFFGFSHTLDMGWEKDHYCRSWELLGLNQFGPLVDVDQTAYPFGNSRRLITSADVNKNADRAHNAVVPGGTAVKDAKGNYIHEKVWEYLFTHPIEAVGDSVPSDADCNKEPH